MKKLLTLILVLGLVPMASAGIVLSNGEEVDVSIDPVNGITLISLNAKPTPWMVYVVPSNVPLVYEFHQFGDLNQNDDYGVFRGEEFGISDPELYVWLMSVASTEVGFLKPGPYWTGRLDLPGIAGVNYVYQAERPDDPSKILGRIDFADYDTMEIFGTAYAVVPEPATMLLLGLGGLFLRRK